MLVTLEWTLLAHPTLAADRSVIVASTTIRDISSGATEKIGARALTRMVYENPVRVERRINRLTRELEDMDEYLYGFHRNSDRFLYMGELERKRDDVVRSAVLQIHTAIEDLMTDMLFSEVLGSGRRRSRKKRRHTKRGQALDRMLDNLGFHKKLDFAIVVGIINSKIRDRLNELNKIRNRCSHNWLLNVPLNPRKRTKGKRPRLLSYGGHDLHQVTVLKDLMSEFSGIYLRLYRKSIGS